MRQRSKTDVRHGAGAEARPDFVALLDRSGAVVRADRPLNTLFAQAPAGEREALLAGILSVCAGTSRSYTREYGTDAPDVRRFRLCAVAFDDDDDAVAVVYQDDVTADAFLHARLHELEETFSGVFEQAALGIVIVSLDGAFLRTNQRFCEIVGTTEGDLSTKTCFDVTHPDDRPYEGAMRTALLAGSMQSASWDMRFLKCDGSPVWCRLSFSVQRDQAQHPLQFVGVIEDIAERRRAHERLQRSESLLRIASQTARFGGWSAEVGGDRITWSDEACAIFEVPAATQLTHSDVLAFTVPDMRAALQAANERCRRDGAPFDLEYEIVGGLGSRRWVRSIGHAERDERGNVIMIQGAIQDITERKTAELEIVRMNRALLMRTRCNEALVRETDEDRLLTNVCRIAVEVGGYQMAMVAFAQNDAGKSIVPKAVFGSDTSYFDEVKISWSETDQAGLGPAGMAIRSGEPAIIEDVQKDPRFAPWREIARRHGFAANASLPLRDGTRAFGVLGLYSPTVQQITPQEVALFQEMANDLALGILQIRNRIEQRRMQEAVMKVAAAVTTRSKAEFFEELVRSAIDAVGAFAGYIARISETGPIEAHSIAAIVDGSLAERLDYRVAGTPCEALLTQESIVGQGDLASCFPHVASAVASGMSTYLGQQLADARGKPIGFFVLLFRDQLETSDLAMSTLRIFASRASAEIERLAAEQSIEQLAFFDPLTRLPNRTLLHDRLSKALAASSRTNKLGALIFLDLDNFKILNDTLGHDKGDLLLQEVSKRLVSCVRERDTVSRFGGDEFVVLLEDLSTDLIETARAARIVGDHILSCFQSPFVLADYEQTSTPSIGITIFDGTGNTEELLKQADLAMYQAKEAGRNAIRFFDPEMQATVTERHALEAELRHALKHDEFSLQYQPQIDEDGAVTGAEALLRWQHRMRGAISPGEFIPLAEHSGLIRPLGLWVLEAACAQLAQWNTDPLTAHLMLSINVSPREFRHQDFVENLLLILDRTQADPAKLKLELTESLLLDDLDATVAKMIALKLRGIGFSLDDFGTGYSSLYYIKRLPIDELKIDQSFIQDALTDANDAAIARTIIALGQTLGLHIIAEGVETGDQRDFLAMNGCRAYQGYYFSRPLSAVAFADFVGSRAR
jgi:diguanylate cyclase (GGDEF)-like protein/PAS domain S-box-containing protein